MTLSGFALFAECVWDSFGELISPDLDRLQGACLYR